MNWQERIEQAQSRGYFNTDDEDLAHDWPSCAVGEKLNGEHLIWNELGIPYDTTQRLNALGTEFSALVTDQEFELAKECLGEIIKVELPEWVTAAVGTSRLGTW